MAVAKMDFLRGKYMPEKLSIEAVIDVKERQWKEGGRGREVEALAAELPLSCQWVPEPEPEKGKQGISACLMQYLWPD